MHGDSDHGFVPLLIGIAREKGRVGYLGEGLNCWAAVHRFDAARLYRLAVEADFAPGTRYHAVAEEGVPMREITTVIGRRLNMPVVSLSEEEAPDYFGWFYHFAAGNNRASSEKTRASLGWEPTGPGLIPDLDRPSYFSI